MQSLLFPDALEQIAYFSPCRQYRYTLWRKWGINEKYVQFIGLNPSTADEIKDDQTIRKCIAYSKFWGFDAFCMTNLFGFRATDPRIMKKAEDPIGVDNIKKIIEIANSADLIIAAWSIHGNFLNQDLIIKQKLANRLFCLGKSKEGHPWHPLYKPADLKPIPFD